MTLQCFSLQMLGSAGGVELCPLSHLHGCLQGPWPQPKVGVVCSGSLVLFFFSFVFISLLSFSTPRNCPWPPATPGPPRHSTAAFSSLPALTRLPKIGSGNSDFPGEAACRSEESRPTAPSEQERAISLMCLVSLLPFKPTYESNEGADSRGEAHTAQCY